MNPEYDLLIVGGGINGCGIARDAAGRGLKVCLVEKDDLASATSSASTKMIHGGLRYLEYYEFSLVRQALKEREVLLRIAPHLIAPLRIVLPIVPGMRPAWMIRMGLWLYDHLGGKISLPGTSTLSLKSAKEGANLAAGMSKAFAYSDGWVDDARLVMYNAQDAHLRGASIKTRTRLTSLQSQDDYWLASVKSGRRTSVITAKSVINATGPWANEVDELGGFDHAAHLVKVQGSHIIVPKLYDGQHAYLFQNPDKRVLFAIPYQGEYTLFGTTDTPIKTDPAKAKLTSDETDYLLAAIQRFFDRQLKTSEIKWSYSGVRALFGDPKRGASALSRDYELVMGPTRSSPAFISILGGKITTYRSLSEKAVNMICARMGLEDAAPWTAHSPLPGGDLATGGLQGLINGMAVTWPFLERNCIERLARTYGNQIFEIFEDANSIADLGMAFGSGAGRYFYEREIRWMVRNEWAQKPDDILWRRSKMGLHLRPAEKKQVAEIIKLELADFNESGL